MARRYPYHRPSSRKGELAARVALALDIGASKARACIGTADGYILSRASTDVRGVTTNEEFLTRLEELARRVCMGYSMQEIVGVGVGAIGPLDARQGVIRAPANLPVRNINIVRHFTELTGKQVILLNDGNAAAWGEFIYGVGRQTRDLVHVSMGTGIGGGAVIDGRLVLGKDGNALEIGHMIVDVEQTMTCGCGQAGHWEAYCGGAGIPRFAQHERERVRRAGEARGSLLDDIQPVSSESVLSAARAGDWLAQRILDRIAHFNLVGVVNLAHIFDPMLITFGGAVALRNSELLIEPLRRELPSRLMLRPPNIMVSPLGEDATLMGAVASVFRPPF
jgi:glucokinase